MAASSTERVQFGVFELDLQRAELRKQGLKVKLQEQPLKILQVLLETPGQIVSREQLRQRIWPANTFVEFDQGLYSAMARLRDALGDSSENPRFIETVARRGYRFVAPLTELAGVPIGSPSKARSESDKSVVFRQWSASLVAGLMGGALLLAAVFSFNLLNAREWLVSRTTPIHSVAVLPLENLSGDPEQEYFADGMTDELITTLAKLGNVKVISRTSVMGYKRTNKPLPQIGRELNADAVVEGTVERSGSRVRIRVQLIHAQSERHLWTQIYDRDAQDALVLQSQAAADIVREIQSSLTPAQKTQLASVRPVNEEAHENYLKGLYFSNKRTVPAFYRSIESYQKAISKDPDYSLAYAGLSEAYVGLYFNHVDRETSRENATQAALRSLELDPDLAEAHLEMADIREYFEWDWASADKEYRRAIELNPNSAFAHQGYALYLAWQGRSDQSLTEARRSQELDPVSPFIRTTYCMDLEYARRFVEAIQKCREAVDLDPGYVHAYGNLEKLYEYQGMYEAAMDVYEKAAALDGQSPASVAEVRQAFSESGINGARRKALQHLLTASYADPYWIAESYARLNENDLTFEWLEKAYQQRSPYIEALKNDFMFESFRSNPHFQDLLRRLRLQ